MRFTFRIEKLSPSYPGPVVASSRTVTLDNDIIKIGTLASSHLLLDDAQVSRMHAVIEVAEASGGWRKNVSIIDLGSAAGTIVNGKKVSQIYLKNGDILTLGRTRIIVSFQ